MLSKDLALLEDVGLTVYERKAPAALLALRRVTGVRYSGELGHPFHGIDAETVVLPLDHPFVRGGRYASLLVRERDLAANVAGGFHELWRKAMRDLREIDFDPRGGT